MKLNNKLLTSFKLLFISSLIVSCSWFGENTEPKNESYESGVKALNRGKFEEAKAHFRNIDQGSPFYPQAVWMIQKVPFKKGLAAFEQKNFQLALLDLSKVPIHSPDYTEAKRYINLSNFYILSARFNQSKEKNRFTIIEEMVNISNETGDSKLLIDSLDIIKKGIDTSANERQMRNLINLLGVIVAMNKIPEVHQKALNYLLSDFGQFYDKSGLRPQVLQIIGNLKLSSL